MKKKIIVLAIYLVGCFCGYKYTKYNLEHSLKEWTKGDRTFSIILSSGSWLTVVSMAIIHGINSIDNDEPATW